MRFKELDEPVFTTEPYYDLFDGGYIKPCELLADEADIKSVEQAIQTIRKFLQEAEDEEVLELG
jgi:arginine/ornithine N-succinyltransferase beta subunit